MNIKFQEGIGGKRRKNEEDRNKRYRKFKKRSNLVVQQSLSRPPTTRLETGIALYMPASSSTYTANYTRYRNRWWYRKYTQCV